MANGWFKGSVAGRLGKDPELRTTQGGKTVCSVSVGASIWRGGKTDTVWVEISAWGKTGEYLANYGHKGDFVCAQGDLTPNTWTDRNGTAHSTWKLQVSDLVLVSKKRGTDIEEDEDLPL